MKLWLQMICPENGGGKSPFYLNAKSAVLFCQFSQYSVSSINNTTVENV